MSDSLVMQDRVFQSTPSAWRETADCEISFKGYGKFQSTPSAWRETGAKDYLVGQTGHFNPLPPHGGRRKDLTIYNVTTHFNPLPPHGGRLCRSVFQALRQLISIHSLRMEGDTLTDSGWSSDIISIHSLRMEGDSSLLHDLVPQNRIFQSTPSAWRETRLTFEPNSTHLHFNPLPPHGGRPSTASPSAMDLLFQSTPSAWRETEHGFDRSPDCFISIHSLRMEGDPCFAGFIQPHFCISIHSLRMEGDFAIPYLGKYAVISIHSIRMEGDRLFGLKDLTMQAFQSTPSAWRETSLLHYLLNCFFISIHSLRMEGDSLQIKPLSPATIFQSTPSAWRETYLNAIFIHSIRYFNPLPPHGGRPNSFSIYTREQTISIHSLRMEGDVPENSTIQLRCGISIHSLRMEGDHLPQNHLVPDRYFNPLPPHGGRHPV